MILLNTKSDNALSIFTTTANDTVRPIQPGRMPIILHSEHFEQWLSGSEKEAEWIVILVFAATRLLRE
jgi:putative SOS response-associated peptidase YedK